MLVTPSGSDVRAIGAASERVMPMLVIPPVNSVMTRFGQRGTFRRMVIVPNLSKLPLEPMTKAA